MTTPPRKRRKTGVATRKGGAEIPVEQDLTALLADPKLGPILNARADRLARYDDTGQDEAAALRSYLVFELQAVKFAIAVDALTEVVRSQRITPVPGASDGYLGVTNRRGEIVPVHDLRRVLGMTAHRHGTVTNVLFLKNKPTTKGLGVDRFAGIVRLREDDLSRRADGYGIAHDECVEGVTNDLMVVLNATTLKALLNGEGEGVPQASTPDSTMTDDR